MQTKSCEIHSNNKFIGSYSHGKYSFITYQQFSLMVDKFRGVLSLHNIGVDDKVALISNNRLEWAVSYFAINGLGAQIIPMYEAQKEEDWKYIIKDSEAKLILVATDKIYGQVESYINTVTIITFLHFLFFFFFF